MLWAILQSSWKVPKPLKSVRTSVMTIVIAIKLARVYLSGLAKVVWQPDEATVNCVKSSSSIHGQRVYRQRNRIRSFLNEYCVRYPKGLT